MSKTKLHKKPAQKKALKNSPTNSGFTLLELLVVIAIIGILASIIIIAMNDARSKGRDAKRVGDMRQMLNAMEQYHVQYGIYPIGSTSVPAGGALLSDPGAFDGTAEPFTPNFVPFIPTSPVPADGGCLSAPGKGNNNYWYETDSEGSTYSLTFCLGNNNGDWQKGTRTLTPDGIH